MSRIIVLVSAATFVVGGPRCLTAQQPSAASVRTEVQQAVRTYVDAWNKADASNLVEMYSRDAGVTSVGDGEIIRGWDRIRERYDSLVGVEGRFKLSIGSIDVVPMGASNALALTSYTLTVHADAGDMQQRGAMTLVFQKSGGEWKVIHDHTSTLPTKTDASTSQAGRATVAPRPTPSQGVSVAASPAPAPEVRRYAVAESEAQIVREGSFVYYKFQVNAVQCAVSGRIIGLAGGNRDFQALIMDENSFLNWQTNHQAQAYWQSGQVAATNISARLAGPATYYLVVSNAFSPITAKTVKVQAVADC